jgi:uncharacterized Zn finger protein
MSWGYYGFRPYVPVAERRRNAQKEAARLAKKGKVIRPIKIEGRTIASTFWGKAWCDNLESYSDFENRLPRGRTYVRNGSVVHLEVRPGEIEALVSGSELYKVRIQIVPTAQKRWQSLCRECAGGIGSLIELLQGRFSDQVMDILTRKETGLFPSPSEIHMKCSCPDWATMCKHVAAVLYGVGARLDQNPELLFILRSVNHEELISQAAGAADLAAKAAGAVSEIAESEISSVFGIELDKSSSPAPAAQPPESAPAPRGTKKARKQRSGGRRTGKREPAARANT